jgi:hypothetical protein
MPGGVGSFQDLLVVFARLGQRQADAEALVAELDRERGIFVAFRPAA